ncbi:SHOCT domain-containing protein [Thermoplasma sp.]|uniref:SHOCT domain-containing protein n=1 Tax=Thermoplasma sp. TaxID=1973142 RepID=UPI0025D98288|nr:SHOCT domain-containing protein [Thermoplasma sp.]
MEKRIENLIWVLVGLVAVVAAVAIITSILFGGRYYNGYYGPYRMMGGFYGMGIIMPIMGVISVILVLIFIYFILEAIRGPVQYEHTESVSRAEEIAKERLARGEITEEEYRRIIENIRK